MTRRLTLRILAVVVLMFVLCSSAVFAQGKSDQAFERVKQVQERNTERLMALKDVEGVAIGYDENNELAIKVFTAGPGVAGIPRNIEGVPVRAEVTGIFYALAPGGNFGKPESPNAGKPPKGDTMPPATPSIVDVSATNNNNNEISISWGSVENSDLNGYNIYRSIYSSDSYIKIGSVGKTITTFNDSYAAPYITYYYKVTAFDTSRNESSPSLSMSASTSYTSITSAYPIGVWVYRYCDDFYGTIGCRVKDTISGNVYALSNNHVLANCNNAYLGDNIIHADIQWGANPNDAIGVLYDFMPINFSYRANNTIDAAIALCSTNTLGNSTPVYKPSSSVYPLSPADLPSSNSEGLAVKKYGARTNLTTGHIYAMNGMYYITYGSNLKARFVGQIAISDGTFSDGGDSGSLIVTESENRPVALLFAGNSSITIANPIGPVLAAFNVEIDGN
jgi:hypothetical protein